MLLAQLFEGVNCIIKGSDVDIKNVQKNSSDKVTSGLFFCYQGINSNGEDFVGEAINNGAVAIVVEEYLPFNLTQIKVDNVRKIIAKVCSNFFGSPDKKLKIIGVTGTNGKTTTTYILKNILKTAGKKVGLIGTNNVEIGEVFYKATLTTPDPQELFDIFSKMVKAQIEYVVMEVSAHALDLYKVWGVKFEVGAFTNLTRDHLDYFGNMQSYKKAKATFFNKTYCRNCVFNLDDDVGREFYNKCDCNKYSYALINPSDLFAVDIEMSISGSKYVVNCLDEIMYIQTVLPGKFNIYNCMAAILVARLLNISTDHIVAGLYTLASVKGRFNLFEVEGKSVVIDFAHTPDGIENVLRTAKSLSKGSITTIFGCGGNRDKGKRQTMGQIASKYSDKVILTSDNPRFENAYQIIDQIKQGANDAIVIENRREAIITGITTSGKDSCILILGKGAEDYQEINGIKYPYSDYTVVEEYIKNKKLSSKE